MVACEGLQSRIRNEEETDDHDTRPHKPVRCEVRCQKELEDVRVLKLPKPLPGASGGKYFPPKTACPEEGV